MTGVAQHSDYRDDPLGRLRRTANFLGVLAQNRRLGVLPEVAAMYEELRAEVERATAVFGMAVGDLEMRVVVVDRRLERFGQRRILGDLVVGIARPRPQERTPSPPRRARSPHARA